MATSSKISDSSTSLTNIASYEAGIVQASAIRLIRKITDASLHVYGITTMQWFTIGLVHDSGSSGISVTELSQLLGTNIPYITNTTNVLVERNIITRTSHENNGRRKLLRLNPKFTPMVAKIETSVRSELRKKIYSNVTPQELLTYIRVLYKFSGIR